MNKKAIYREITEKAWLAYQEALVSQQKHLQLEIERLLRNLVASAEAERLKYDAEIQRAANLLAWDKEYKG